MADDGEDRRKHLEFIQSVVGRMAAASSVAKGWCLTVATAAFGYAITNDSGSTAVLGICAVLLFGYVDASYLREERKFRALYEDARRKTVDVFDLSTGAYINRKDARFDERCGWWCVLRSWSVWSFYLPLVAIGAVVGVAAW